MVVASASVEDDQTASDDDVPTRPTFVASALVHLERLLGHIPTDLFAPVSYLLYACAVLYHMLAATDRRIVANNPVGQGDGEWMLAHGLRIFTHGASPFYSGTLNVPSGVNIMANHGMLGLSIPLAPLTALIGPTRTMAVVLVLALAGTAYAWYWVLSRHLVGSHSAAYIGGALAGFAPGMVAHDQGDLDLAAAFLVPFLIWRVVRLASGKRTIRNGAILGLLAAWQTLIGEEALFFFVVAMGVFLISYAVQKANRDQDRIGTFLRGLGAAAIVWFVLMAYPLYEQFFGTAHHNGGPSLGRQGVDLFSFVRFAAPGLATWPLGRVHYAVNASEQNTFFGWMLLLVLVLIVWWLGRTTIKATVLAVSITWLVMAWLSTGSRLLIRGQLTAIPGPWQLFSHIPYVRTIPPRHVALALIPIATLLLAYGAEQAERLIRRTGPVAHGIPLRVAWYGLLLAALLPIAPTPIKVVDTVIPKFVSDGTWRQYVPAGRTMMVVPFQTWGDPSGLRWAAATGTELALTDRAGGKFLDDLHHTGVRPFMTDQSKTALRSSIQIGRVAAVVMPPGGKDEEILWRTLSDLLGFKPRFVDGVWLWDVRTA
jgi:hypothetical protein